MRWDGRRSNGRIQYPGSVELIGTIRESLDAIMKVYEVPAETREKLLAGVMATDYRSKGSIVFEEFCRFVGEKMRCLGKTNRT